MSKVSSSPQQSGRRFPRVFRWFEPAPAIAPLSTNPQELKTQFRYWQWRILIGSIGAYAMYYCVRKNISFAIPAMGEELGISKAKLGIFLTLHGLLYGVSKFAHGFVADRANARTLMAVGLVLSAMMNIAFGFSSAVITFGVFWMINGWVQGIGFPPCARLMTHWFSPRELATKMSIWNTSHSLGAGAVAVLCGYMVAYNWRLCFFVPAALAILGAVFTFVVLRDTPPSLGLPEVEGTEKPSSDSPTDPGSEKSFSSFLLRQVFANPYLWMIALANFFVYSVRYAVLDWGPTLLKEMKGIQLEHAGWIVAAFEIAGLAGMLLSGWLTDKVFGGRGARTCTFSMLLAGLSVFLFWKVAGQSVALCTVLLCCAGFFIYGPQALVGITAANLATKRAAATAVGFTGLFAYASTILSGWGLGLMVDKYGWDACFSGFIALAGIGAVLFALAWPAKAHGYAVAQDTAAPLPQPAASDPTKAH